MGMGCSTNYAKTTLHWSPSFSMLQIYEGVLLFIIIVNGFASVLPCLHYWADHSTMLSVMMTENLSWSSWESLTIITLPWWQKIIIVTYSISLWQTSSALSCNDNGVLINVILVKVKQSSFLPYCHDESLKVFTLSRWQNSHHCYIFMMMNYSYFVLPTDL